MSRKRTLVIGDIHSGFMALEQVLQMAEITEEDTLIFLGDYVDGWSQAAETVDFLIQLNRKHHCVLLRGNHDELCLNWLQEGSDNPMWFQHGGKATIASYKKLDDVTIDAHMIFYQNLKNYYLDANNRLFLHAGFTNLSGVEHEYFPKVFYWDRTLWELARSIIGHTPISKTGIAVPEREANVWNIDTGAAFRGPLSIMDVDSKRVWQSEPVHTFYPGERGRN